MVGTKEELLSQYPNLFILLVTEFARLKKDTYISEELCELYNIFFNNNVQSVSEKKKFLLPEFQYGILLPIL